MLEKEFWKNKSLDAFTHEEWEALCDGCGLCCLIKIMDEGGEEVFYTDVVCRYHDSQECRCTVYGERTKLVPTCLVVTPDIADSVEWIPETCAYRLLAEGKPLPAWHPLVAGSTELMHSRGNSVKGRVISEVRIPESRLEEHIIFIWNEA
ncbi:MAG: YcgN family cysteine cluster protein [Anaerolineaceae bacterium]|nr:YcgN family cysteine cluster protein [Anaerolineaceae bacterium]